MPRKVNKPEVRYLENGTLVEVLESVPYYRLTGINAYKAPECIQDEWARVLELRKQKKLVKGGNWKEKPSHNNHIATYRGVVACTQSLTVKMEK